jgi:hypothetical protein
MFARVFRAPGFTNDREERTREKLIIAFERALISSQRAPMPPLADHRNS